MKLLIDIGYIAFLLVLVFVPQIVNVYLNTQDSKSEVC
jgi:hypothetical protein